VLSIACALSHCSIINKKNVCTCLVEIMNNESKCFFYRGNTAIEDICSKLWKK
jgi:hypothetical protein